MDGENASSPSPRLLSRAGSLSAVALATGYVAIMALYVAIGAPPTATATFLDHLARHSGAWWAIVGLSVFTDLLLLPVVAALIVTSGRYAAVEAGEKATLLGAATYPAAVLGSPLFSAYAILLPSLGDTGDRGGDFEGPNRQRGRLCRHRAGHPGCRVGRRTDRLETARCGRDCGIGAHDGMASPHRAPPLAAWSTGRERGPVSISGLVGRCVPRRPCAGWRSR